MKKILTLVLALTLVAAMASMFGVSARETTTELDVPKVTTVPTIDAEIDECWDYAPEVDVVNFGSNIYPATSTAKADKKNPVAKAKARLMWDENHLYALVRVYDSTPNGTPSKANPDDCDYDSVDFQISEQNVDNQSLRDDTVGTDNKLPGNGIFNVNINGKLTGWGGVWYADDGASKTSYAAKTTDYGYIIEIAIPLQTITAAEGDNIGFEFQINDNQFGEGRSAIRQWAADQCLAHSGTKYLGKLNLVAASTEKVEYTEFTTEEETTTEEVTTKAEETTEEETTVAAEEEDDETTKAKSDDETESKTNNKKGGSSESSNTGLIIGIIAGVVVVAVVVVVIIIVKKKKN